MNNKSVSIKNVTKCFDDIAVLNNITIEIEQGEKVALLGPSGAGKTTLLNILSKSSNYDNGDISILNNSITEFTSRKDYSNYVGIVRQQFDLVLELKVIHNVLAGRLNKWGFFKSLLSLFMPLDRHIAEEALKSVGLIDKINSKTSDLSGGEQQRVALARLLVQDPKIILADEPVASLDPARAEDVLFLLNKISDKDNKTLITTLHSVDYALKFYNRIIGLKDGIIVIDKPVSDITINEINMMYKLEDKQMEDEYEEQKLIEKTHP